MLRTIIIHLDACFSFEFEKSSIKAGLSTRDKTRGGKCVDLFRFTPERLTFTAYCETFTSVHVPKRWRRVFPASVEGCLVEQRRLPIAACCACQRLSFTVVDAFQRPAGLSSSTYITSVPVCRLPILFRCLYILTPEERFFCLHCKRQRLLACFGRDLCLPCHLVPCFLTAYFHDIPGIAVYRYISASTFDSLSCVLVNVCLLLYTVVLYSVRYISAPSFCKDFFFFFMLVRL